MASHGARPRWRTINFDRRGPGADYIRHIRSGHSALAGHRSATSGGQVGRACPRWTGRRPGLLECCISGAVAERGQDTVVVRAARHVSVQSAAAFGLRERACGCEQANSALRGVLLPGDRGQRRDQGIR